MTGNKDMEVV